MAKKKTTKKKKNFITKLCILLLVLLILVAIFLIFAPTQAEVASTLSSTQIPNLELPTPIKGAQLIEHTGYTLS